MVGTTIAHYHVIEKIGGGGMGDVFRAEDTELKRTVALKFLPRELTIDESARQRFKHEAQAASALDHPNVGTIFQILESDDLSFIAMACYDGGSLKDRIADGPMSVDRALNIACQIARGLRKAHAEGIVHRDIKPANIMFADDDQVKIVDFGLAKLAGQTGITRTGTTLGTIAYMSPEQARGEVVDHRADLWALGAILYEMLTGGRPFAGDYDQAVVYAILNEDAERVTSRRPDVPPAVEAVVAKALEKDPERRYQSADDMLHDLMVVLDGRQPAMSARRSALARRLRRRKKALIGAALVVVLTVTAFGLEYLRSDIGRDDLVAIAVLPIVSDSEEDLEWFTNGMTDALITDLAQIANLRVISRNSVMRYRDTNQSAEEIARELNVAYVVDGSVNKQGSHQRRMSGYAHAPLPNGP